MRGLWAGAGYVYTGVPYAESDLEDVPLCPWCIAQGRVASRFAAEFVDPEAIGGYGRWDEVPPGVVEEVSQRTPAFLGWQDAQWWTHCGDAAEYLGRAGRPELENRWPEAIEPIRQERGLDGSLWQDYFAALHADGDTTAYVFRCRHCGTHGGYSDSS